MSVPDVRQRILSWAERTPAAVALIDESGRATSYAELAEQALGVRDRLVRDGVLPGTPVAVEARRQTAFVVAALGIMLAGALYVPIDPDTPQDRQDWIQSHTGAATHLSLADVSATPPANGGAMVDNLSLDQPAYVIHTSGSTGRPKGVLVGHRQLAELVASTQAEFRLAPDDVWSQFHSTAFDFSVWEIWVALATGGRVVVVPHWTRLDAAEFISILRERRITVLSQTPTAFAQLDREIHADTSPLPDLRLVVFGGELLRPAHITRWVTRFGTAGMVNMYGITEVTVHATLHRLTERDLTKASIPIGHALSGWEVWVGNDVGRPVPHGEVGELWVAGRGVADGYWNEPALTRERFRDVPAAENSGLRRRAYRSGDLAMVDHDGDLVCLGRADRQVKIRGHRVELGEIEDAAGRLIAGRAIALVDETPDEAEIVVFVDNLGADEACLLKALREVLPREAVPARAFALPRFPADANGKVDHRALHRLTTRENTARSSIGVTAKFAEILHRETVDDTDDFFDLGGSSLGAVRLAKLLSSPAREVSVADIYRARTPAALRRLTSGRGHADPDRQRGSRWIVLVPPAGAGASAYAGWPDKVEGDWGVHPVTLGGREHRLGDPSPRTIDDAVDDALTTLPTLAAGTDFILVGHSFGGTVAFEMAKRLPRFGCRVVLLVLLCVDPPHLAASRDESQLPDEQFVAALERRTGHRFEALHDPELREMLLPALRADVRAAEMYRASPPTTGTTPVFVYSASGDLSVPPARASEWRHYASSFHHETGTGSHMDILTDPAAVLAGITKAGQLFGLNLRRAESR